MKFEISQDTYYDYIDYMGKINSCGTTYIGHDIVKIDYDKMNDNDYRRHMGLSYKEFRGRERFHSCKKRFCPKCMSSLAYSSVAKINERVDMELYDHVYHLTFSPEFEFWDYGSPQYVRKLFKEVFDELFDKQYQLVIGLHYIGDKENKKRDKTILRPRLHFHILVFLNKPYPLNKETFRTGSLYKTTDDKSDVVLLFKQKLSASRKFNWSKRCLDIGTDYFNLYIVNLKRRHEYLVNIRKELGVYKLEKAVWYMAKYLAFGNTKGYMKRIGIYVKYYLKMKMKMIVYYGDFYSGRKIKNLRRFLRKRRRDKKTKLVLEFFLKFDIPTDWHIIDIDEYFKLNVKNHDVIMNYLIKRNKDG